MFSELLEKIGSGLRKGFEGIANKAYEYSESGLPGAGIAKDTAKFFHEPFLKQDKETLSSMTKLGGEYEPKKVAELTNIFKDSYISPEEGKSIGAMGQTYVDIANKANNATELSKLIFSDDFDKYDEPTKQQYFSSLQNSYDTYKKSKDKYVSMYGDEDFGKFEDITKRVDKDFAVNIPLFKELSENDKSPGKSLMTGLKNYEDMFVKERQYLLTPKEGQASEDTMKVVKTASDLSTSLMSDLLKKANEYSKEKPGATFEDFLQNKVQTDYDFNRKFNDLLLTRKVVFRANKLRDKLEEGNYVMAAMEGLGLFGGVLSEAAQEMVGNVRYGLGGSALGGLDVSGPDLTGPQKLYRGGLGIVEQGAGDVIAMLLPNQWITKAGQAASKIPQITKVLGAVDDFMNGSRMLKATKTIAGAIPETIKEGVIGTSILNQYSSPYLTNADFASNAVLDFGFNGIMRLGSAGKNFNKIDLLPIDKVNQAFVSGLKEQYPDLDPNAIQKLALGKKNEVLNLIGTDGKINVDKVTNTLSATMDYLDSTLGKEAGEGAIGATEKAVSGGGKVVSRENRANVLTFIDNLRKSDWIPDNTANTLIEKVNLGDQGEISNVLNDIRRGFEDARVLTKSNIDNTVSILSRSANETGLVEYSKIESLLNRTGEILKGNMRKFVGQEFGKEYMNVDATINGIVNKFETTGKLSDKDTMDIVSAYAKKISGGKKDVAKTALGIASFMGRLGYVVSDDAIQKLSQRLRKSSELFKNLYEKGIDITLTGENESLIENGLIKLSYLSDYYKGNPEKFVMALVHEMTHGIDSIVNAVGGPMAKQVEKINKAYETQSETFRNFLSKYIYGRDTDETIGKMISDMEKSVGKYETLGPDGLPINDVEKPAYNAVKRLAYRYANVNEFLSYNLSEHFLGKATDEAVSDIANMVQGLGKEFGKGNDELFREVALKLQDAKFKVGLDGLKEAKNIVMTKSKAMKIVGSFMKTVSEGAGASLYRLAKSFGTLPEEDIGKSLASFDPETYKIYDFVMNNDGYSSSMKSAIKENMVVAVGMGFRGESATIASTLYTIFYKTAGDVFTGFRSANTPEKLEKYFAQNQTKLDQLKTLMEDFVADFAYKSKDTKKMFGELYNIAHYYSVREKLKISQSKPEFSELAVKYKIELERLETGGGKTFGVSYKSSIEKVKGDSEVTTAQGAIKRSSFYDGQVDIAHEFMRSLGSNAEKEGKSSGLLLFGMVAERMKLTKSTDLAESEIGRLVEDVVGQGNTSSGGLLNNLFATFGKNIEYSSKEVPVLIKSIKEKGVAKTLEDISNSLIDGVKAKELSSGGTRKLFSSLDDGNILDSFYAMGGGKKDYVGLANLIYSSFEYPVAKEIADHLSATEFVGQEGFAKAIADVGVVYLGLDAGSKKAIGLLQNNGVNPARALRGEMEEIGAIDVRTTSEGDYRVVGQNQTAYYVNPNANSVEEISQRVMTSQEYRKRKGLEGFVFNDTFVYDANNVDLFNMFDLSVKGVNSNGGASKAQAIADMQKTLNNYLLDIKNCV